MEQKDTGISQKELSKTIYNNETDAEFPVSNSYTWTGWTLTGWTTATGADEIPMYGNLSTYNFMDNITLYALYVRDVTLSYDTNGSSVEIEEQTKEAYHNAAGNSQYPTFVTASAPELANHSFINWKVERGTVQDSLGNQKTNCEPGILVTVSNDTLLTAAWDAYPEIEAYDRYFTLDEAKSGAVTEETLLEKVKATDLEDGILVNGVSVVVKEYDESVFENITEDTAFEITYQATDSFGNMVERTVTVRIVDTTMKESSKVRYIRFISKRFYADEAGNLLAPERGGLENTSIWRTNDTYKSVLESALYNSKINEEYKTVEYFGTSMDVKVAGSGEWQTENSTWVFTKDDIEEVKSFVDTHGYGNIKEPNALEVFIQLFSRCFKES